MRRRPKLDANQKTIEALFRAHGCEWVSTAALGSGFPDALVGWKDRIALVEVKTPTGTARAAQTRFHRRFPVWTVRNASDVAGVVYSLKGADDYPATRPRYDPDVSEPR